MNIWKKKFVNTKDLKDVIPEEYEKKTLSATNTKTWAQVNKGV